MKDWCEIITKKIDELHSDIQYRNAQLKKTVEDFQQFVSQANSYDIVTFLPGKIRAIEWERQRIEELEAQARMLVWMEREVEK